MLSRYNKTLRGMRFSSAQATGDIDIWIRAVQDNAARVWKALKAFGAPTSQISVDDLCMADIVYQIGVAPQRIDFLTSISGADPESYFDSDQDAAR